MMKSIFHTESGRAYIPGYLIVGSELVVLSLTAFLSQDRFRKIRERILLRDLSQLLLIPL